VAIQGDRVVNKPESEIARLWTPANLAERWQCSVDTVMNRVRERGVPYLWLGTGEARLARRGAKLVRFRPRAIEAWEAEQEGRLQGRSC
jgi:hypothetical protein